MRLSEAFQIKPPKSEARRTLKGSELVSFVPMNDLPQSNKFFAAAQEKPLDKVIGSYTYFADNDVLLAKITPCFENGKLGIARNLTNGVGFGSSEYIVFRSTGVIFPEFLYYFLSQDTFRNAGKRVMSGAVGHKRVPKDFIENHLIPTPPLPEQHRIVAILDEAFEGIATATANAEKNLKNARDLFDSYLNAVFTQKGEGWVERTFGDSNLIQIVDGDRGTNYPKKADFLDKGFCLFLNTKNVRPDGFNFDKVAFISEEKDTLLRKGKLKRRDVVLTTRGTLGNVALYDDSINFNHIRINSGMLIFRTNERKITSEYLFEFLRSGIMKSQIKRFATGAAQPQLPIKTLINFSIPIPTSIHHQNEIVSRLRCLFAETQRLKSIYQKKLTALAELKQSLLQKAFSGELTAESASTIKEEALA